MNRQTVGYIDDGASPVIADVNSSGWAPLMTVTLSTAYEAVDPPGFPSRPPAGTAQPWHPQTIAAGTVFETWPCEAAAIIAAGAGVPA